MAMVSRVAWVEATVDGDDVTFGLAKDPSTYTLPTKGERSTALKLLLTSLSPGGPVMLQTTSDGTVRSVRLTAGGR